MDVITRALDQAAPDWRKLLAPELDKAYMHDLARFLMQEQASHPVYPPENEIFTALRLPPDDIRVVILGQDPYHGAGQAHGLAFSVRRGVKIPPSLRNIYKEVFGAGGPVPFHGDLTGWARQGVLLLNTSLTVRHAAAGSHQKRGWEKFTDAVIRIVSDQVDAAVFMLWGSPAQKKATLIDTSRHLILNAPHPSPLSAHRGFLGCGHFTRANDWLVTHGRKPVDWAKLD